MREKDFNNNFEPSFYDNSNTTEQAVRLPTWCKPHYSGNEPVIHHAKIETGQGIAYVLAGYYKFLTLPKELLESYCQRGKWNNIKLLSIEQGQGMGGR